MLWAGKQRQHSTMDSLSTDDGRWRDLDRLLARPGNIVAPGFDPSPQLREEIGEVARVLVVGAGGLGCELLKDLALSGFKNIDVIDMDTIEDPGCWEVEG